MHRRLRRFFTTLREKSSVSYAKLAAVSGISDIHLIIVKATAPDEDLLLQEKYVHELHQIFSISPCTSIHAFALSFSRRFGYTQCWRVALKCLLLLHRLLRSLPDNTLFRAELLWARSNGFLSLYPCLFTDHSSSYSDDYTIFVRAYARFIDEALCFDVLCFVEEVIHLMEEMRKRLEMLLQLQSLIDRVIDCQPTGPASAGSFIVGSAMKHIIRDSFVCYTMFRTENLVVLENLFQMPYRICESAFDIYKKAALQSIQLSEFFEWCESKGICGSHEYPFVERIPQIQIRALETLLDQMWQFTESSSSTPSMTSASTSSVTDHDDDCADPCCTLRSSSLGKEKDRVVIFGKQWENFEETSCLLSKEEEEEEEGKEPLLLRKIALEESTSNEHVSWEKLLEESVNLSPDHAASQSIIPYPNPNHSEYGYFGYVYGHGYI